MIALFKGFVTLWKTGIYHLHRVVLSDRPGNIQALKFLISTICESVCSAALRKSLKNPFIDRKPNNVHFREKSINLSRKKHQKCPDIISNPLSKHSCLSSCLLLMSNAFVRITTLMSLTVVKH